MIFVNSKKGVSTVVATIMMIGLVIIIGVVVWGVINNSVNEQVSNTGSCFGIFGKINIDDRYTCYNSSSNSVRFSLGVSDVDVDAIIVRISSISGTKSFTIGDNATRTDLRFYNETNLDKNYTWVPRNNTGLTYIASGFASSPDSIDISPIIDGSQCESTDNIKDISDCQSLS